MKEECVDPPSPGAASDVQVRCESVTSNNVEDGESELTIEVVSKSDADGELKIEVVSRKSDAPVHHDVPKKKKDNRSEVDLIKEKFAKLLLGEDMSGGSKGVCSASAISNAITNLAASVFGNLLKLEPLPPSKKKMWKREMEWLTSVTDHIVQLAPTVQTTPSGQNIDVMVSSPRPDIQINLPGLRKLDTMLIDCLESFRTAEFWYVEQEQSKDKHEEHWWLPIPKVPSAGLTEESRKTLMQLRDSTNQIFKAAKTINAQVLSEMEVPDAYLEGLPKNGKATLRDLYPMIASEEFDPEVVLGLFNLSNEHQALNLGNRIEAAIHIWHQKLSNKQTQPVESKFTARNSWVFVKEFVGDLEKKEVLVNRADTLLRTLKEKFPGLSQTTLDVQKIQSNRDVGQSVLESYSRVLECLAHNIIARIDGLLNADECARNVFRHSTSSSPGQSRLSSELTSLSINSSYRKSAPASPGRTLADIMKGAPAARPVPTADGTLSDPVNQQQWCSLEQKSPLGRDRS